MMVIGTGSGSCQMANYGVNGVEWLTPTTTVLVKYLTHRKYLLDMARRILYYELIFCKIAFLRKLINLILVPM